MGLTCRAGAAILLPERVRRAAARAVPHTAVKKENEQETGPSQAEPARVAPRTGARVVVEGLERLGVDTVFAYPGGAILDVFDELAKSDALHLILPRHEQGGSHMADGYARATGKPGVCIVTSGPGATNIVTGLATANMDGVPMIAITGQVSTKAVGNDAFQEADTCGITRPVTKHNYFVRDVNDLPRIMVEAFHIATTGKPGPVLIDLPKDVQVGKTAVPFPEKFDRPGYKPSFAGHPRMVSRLAQLVNTANKPLLYVGGGVLAAGASEDLAALARKANIPVATTLMGLGAFPESDPLSLRMIGMHGLVAANKALDACDVLVSVGARFDDRVTGKISEFAPRARIVHVDVDPSAIGKSVRCDLPVVGDVKAVLEALLPLVNVAERKAWLAECAAWKAEDPFSYDPSPSGAIMPQEVLQAADRLLKGDAVVTTDVGQNQMWSCQYFTHERPRSFLSSGGLGTMGFGLPSAIGAQLGRPGETVVCVTGDGGFQMNAQELVVAVEHRLPVKVILLNNTYLGNVRQWQDMLYKGVHSMTHLAQAGRMKQERIVPDPELPAYLPDFVKLAEAHGARSRRVERREDVEPALREAFADDRVWVLEFIVEPEADITPMIPPGHALKDLIRKFK
ncbi:MAG: biosynthetic-type acetolactate synthase large subunit [Kiritimatiellae bacterium]|nr:biosynthetic-type acetolactate synthase large subunit [Kiritimatiellia bacterium]